jgi:uncharacterized LabA/DUF88 family protein
MIPQENNFAYLDGANLHKGILELGWRLDYQRFRVYLRDKYSVDRAYIFLGFVGGNARLYRDLQNWGYIVIFKPTVFDGKGDIKGNCDAELVLQAVSDMYEKQYNKAVIVSGDGDFACLVNFLKERERLKVVLSPNHKKASILLRKAVPNDIVFLERFRDRLERRRK